MNATRALDRERRLLAGVCTYSGCAELAVEGCEHCGPHRDKERAGKRERAARRRLRRQLAGLCRDCGQPSPHVRCMSCREVHRTAVRARRVVAGNDCVVAGERDLSGLISSIRPGRERTLLVTLELPLALLLDATETGERAAPCGHRLCSRDDGRDFCVYRAIKAARRMRQLDGRSPDERGKRGGVEYALTVEQMAQLVGVSTRSIEQSLKAALEKLRGTPEAERVLRALLGD